MLAGDTSEASLLSLERSEPFEDLSFRCFFSDFKKLAMAVLRTMVMFCVDLSSAGVLPVMKRSSLLGCAVDCCAAAVGLLDFLRRVGTDADQY
jgi:hypothetical protein